MILSFLLPQVILPECLDGHGAAANFDVDQAEFAVCPKSGTLLIVGHVLD